MFINDCGNLISKILIFFFCVYIRRMEFVSIVSYDACSYIIFALNCRDTFGKLTL